MTVEELEALFDKVIDADNELSMAESNLEHVKEDNPIPEKPKQTTVAEWIEYKDKYERSIMAIKIAENCVKESNDAFLNIKQRVRKVIPPKVWFHHKDYGIGISYTNWGGNSYELRIRAWKDEMPSLDETYRGD